MVKLVKGRDKIKKFSSTRLQTSSVTMSEQVPKKYRMLVADEIAEQKQKEEERRDDEEQFRIIFEDSPISLWQEDFSGVKRYIDSLRGSGIKDFRGYFENHPEDVCHCAEIVKVLLVNKATLDMYEAGNKEAFFGNLEKVFSEDSYDLFREQLITIAEGRKIFEGEGTNKTLKGQKKYIRLKWSVAPGCEETLSKVMISIIDISDFKRSEDRLRKHHNELELQVKERTKKLRAAIKVKTQNEKKLSNYKLSLEKVNRQLLETNRALAVLARNIDKEKEDLEKKIYKIVSSKIMPIVKELKEDKFLRKCQADLELLAAYLNNLIYSFTNFHEIDIFLTDQEMRVAVMVKNGLTGPKIANLLNISLNTVKTHRKNIRKKLKIQNSKVNLASFLKSKF